MARQLWQLLLDDSTELTCDECFALTEYYAEILASAGDSLLPKVLDHLKSCPQCSVQHRDTLRRLTKSQSEGGGPPQSDPADGAAHKGDRGKMVGEEPWENRSA
jgi:hypothetical protein